MYSCCSMVSTFFFPVALVYSPAGYGLYVHRFGVGCLFMRCCNASIFLSGPCYTEKYLEKIRQIPYLYCFDKRFSLSVPTKPLIFCFGVAEGNMGTNSIPFVIASSVSNWSSTTPSISYLVEVLLTSTLFCLTLLPRSALL